MQHQKSHPYYKNRPIASIGALAKVLHQSAPDLLKIANNADNRYRVADTIAKTDGSVRQTYDALEPLKTIQGFIQKNILRNVYYPTYLQGGIKDVENPRHYLTNAKMHCGSQIIISEDISNFFPTTAAVEVEKTWRLLFRFPPIVAKCLTQLTTKHGALPQGARTSTALANLVFWDIEPELVERLKLQGLTYSRFVDDIHVSSKHYVDSEQIARVVADIYRMLRRKQVSPKRAKHKIYTNGNVMQVHRVNVNARYPTMPRTRRSSIRAAVRHCENMAKDSRSSMEYQGLYHSTMGLVGTFCQLHPRVGVALKQRLRRIKPIRIQV